MNDRRADDVAEVGSVTVRYWAAARDATGVREETVARTELMTLADLLAEVRRRHRSRPRVARVLDVCSLVVDDRPVGARPPASIRLGDGETIEVLPPFAGGA